MFLKAHNMTLKQINKELSNLACGFPTLCFGGPVNNSMFHWQATVSKSYGKLCQGGVVSFAINFPTGYPFKNLKLTL